MRINHNISALNASNHLRANDNAISKNLQKLSSGYRINSAADDAAGLAVSEKMRSQINGLNQAEDNAQNGVSLVQTAEGGLNETESILQRMNTLAVESANGTYQNDTDRANLNKEITALKSEVDRISTSTNFNGINLLDGSLSTPTINVSTAVGGGALTSTAAVADKEMTTALKNNTTVNDSDSVTVTYQDKAGNSHTVTATLTYTKAGDTSNAGQVTGGSGTVYTESDAKTAGYDTGDFATAMASELGKQDSTFSSLFDVTANSTGALVITSKTAGSTVKATDFSETQVVGGTSTPNASAALTQKAAGTDATDTLDASKMKVYGSSDGTTGTSSLSDAIFTVNGQKFAFANSAADAKKFGADVNVVTIGTANAAAKDTDATAMASLIQQKTGLTSTANTTNISFTSKGQSVAFQIGSDNKADQRVSLSVGDMSSKGLGIENVSVATQDDAESAIDTIKTAVNSVSATRSDLGALQNRLEHTSNNLTTMSENLTSAESTIRDVDMSSEMVDLTKNQILEQAATSMLAQANSMPQSVLSLLKG